MITVVKDVEKFIEMLENEEIQIVPGHLTDEEERELSEYFRKQRLLDEQQSDK